MDDKKRTFKPGEKVVWWKRVPGGDYVSCQCDRAVRHGEARENLARFGLFILSRLDAYACPFESSITEINAQPLD